MNTSRKLTSGVVTVTVCAALGVSVTPAVAAPLSGGALDKIASSTTGSSELKKQMMAMMPTIPTEPIGAVVDVATKIGLGEFPPMVWAGMYAEINEVRKAEGVAPLKPCPEATANALRMAKVEAASDGFSKHTPLPGYSALIWEGEPKTAHDLVEEVLPLPGPKKKITDPSRTMQGIGVAQKKNGESVVVFLTH